MKSSYCDSSRMDQTKEEFVGILQDNKRNMSVKQEGQKVQQFVCAFIASIGALIIGSVLGWTSPSIPYLKDPSNFSAPFKLVDKSEESLIAAFTPLGAIIGAIPAGIIADMFGRKLVLIIFTVPWIGTWILTTFASSITMLYAARFIGGIIVGLFCAVLPMYVNEIAENSIRGTLGTLFQVFLTIGILIDYALGKLDSYTILCYTLTVITIAFFAALFFIPESPQFLMKKNRKGEAESALRRLRGPSYDVSTELNDLRKRNEGATQQSVTMDVIFSRANLLALIISIGVMLCQQFSGINAVIFFAQDIFKLAKSTDPSRDTIVLGVMQTLATAASSVLVERAGRKILLLISSITMGLCLVVMGYYFWMKDHGDDISGLAWIPQGAMGLMFIGFSLGLGPLPWMLSGEVLAPEIKSIGTAAAVTTNWTCVALVTFFFKPLSDLISPARTFWMFAVICAMSTVFILTVVPETKGKSIEEVQQILGKKQPKSNNGRV